MRSSVDSDAPAGCLKRAALSRWASRTSRITSRIASPPASARGVQSGLSAFLYDWLFRGSERTFRPFRRGVVTTYALENGAAADGDNRDHSLFAIRAARCSIHEILPIFRP